MAIGYLMSQYPMTSLAFIRREIAELEARGLKVEGPAAAITTTVPVEIILASGGIHEMLRIMLFDVSSYLEITPARILCYHCELLPPLKTIPNLLFEDLSTDERVMREQIEHFFVQFKTCR